MSRVTGTIQGVVALLFAVALQPGCGGGGGSGDTTGPPPGGAEQVDSLVLDLDSADVIVGDTVRIHAEARNADGQVVPGIRLSYVSSDPAVATVTGDGLVTAVDLGEAEIAVGIAGAATTLVASRAAPAVAEAMLLAPRTGFKMLGVPKVVVTPGEQSIDPGATLQYSVSITNLNNQDLRNRPQFSWASDNPGVATIDITGLARGVAEGDAHIIAKFIVGANHVRLISVPLHVTVCGGVFRVAQWDAIADVEYQVTGTYKNTQSKYDIHQISGGFGTLTRVDAQSNSDSTVWEGKFSGDIELNNSVTFPIEQGKTGVTSEVKSGKNQDGPTNYGQLIVKRPPAGERVCTYSFQYSDFFTWEVTNNQGAPPMPMAGPTATAFYKGAEVGPPQDGRLVLGSLDVRAQLPARLLTDITGQRRTAYMPGTFLGIGLLTQLGSPPQDPTYGQASFAYELKSSR